jgi:hypothetical protein
LKKYEEIVTYIKHIIWKFVKCNPEQFNLLDVRYNLMKSLILGDCDHLIKFILFGDEENINNKDEKNEKEKRAKEIRHIPRNILWQGKTAYTKNDDLDFHGKKDSLKDKEEIKPENDMELAIYNCKGNFNLTQTSNIQQLIILFIYYRS